MSSALAIRAQLFACPGWRRCRARADRDRRLRRWRGEHHAFGHAELHLARGEVGDHHGEAAHECRRVVGGLDAGEHRARVGAEIERELQQLVGALDMLGGDDARHAQIDLS